MGTKLHDRQTQRYKHVMAKYHFVTKTHCYYNLIKLTQTINLVAVGTVKKNQYVRLWQVLHINLSALHRPRQSGPVNTLTGKVCRATIQQE